MDSETLQGKQVVLLVATRKGAWLYQADSGRNHWRVDGPHFLGHIINHLVLDPRDGRTLLAAASTGHLGPTIFRSHDLGKTWLEAARPPAFGPAVNGLPARSVAHTFWLAPGPDDERDMWYAGTSPQGLFRSEDGGANWAPFSVINDDPQYREWMGSVQDGTPDGPKLHSIIIDPRDARHIYFAMSGGGCRVPRWRRQFYALVDGMEVVEGFDTTTITFHDPHCVRLCPTTPTVSTSRTTAASTGSTGPRAAGSASAGACRPRSATSAFRWCCTRATTTPPGSFRWTAPTYGPAPAPAASRRSLHPRRR